MHSLLDFSGLRTANTTFDLFYYTLNYSLITHNPLVLGIYKTQQHRTQTNNQLKHENSSTTSFVCNYSKEFSCCLTFTMHNPCVLVNVFSNKSYFYCYFIQCNHQIFTFIHLLIKQTFIFTYFMLFPEKKNGIGTENYYHVLKSF